MEAVPSWLIRELDRKRLSETVLERFRTLREPAFARLEHGIAEGEFNGRQLAHALYVLADLSRGAYRREKEVVVRLCLKLAVSEDVVVRSAAVHLLFGYLNWWSGVSSVYEANGPEWVEFGDWLTSRPTREVLEEALTLGLEGFAGEAASRYLKR